ncbi:MAG: hypothetical protein EKE20_14425 [Candidatus Symbiopectobacterium sp. Dall1.0]|nr:hypothetical protein [Candidatus Symbiopectobacterium sp. Dall1.0]
MHKLFITCNNVITGKTITYHGVQEYKSTGKAMKAVRKMTDVITCSEKYPNDNEYTVKVMKVKRG